MVSEKKREQKRMMLMPITALDGQGIFAFFFFGFCFLLPLRLLLLASSTMPAHAYMLGMLGFSH